MEQQRRPRLACSLLSALLMLGFSTALEFEMQTQSKCIYEEINANVIVVGDYRAFNKDNAEIPVYVDVRVEDPHGVVLSDTRGQAKGQFAFTSKIAGEYKACFTVADIQTAFHTKLKLDWKTGVAAADWDSIAKKEHLDSLTVEMRKLEGTIREVYNEMIQLQQREQELRDLNEETNTRVAHFSVTALLICVGAGGWQLWYLKRFFQRKKLL